MASSSQDPRKKSDDDFPARQLLVLGICRIAEPIAFTSILSYTYVMVRDFQGEEEASASFYAGLLVSAFAVAEACTAMIWGTISDRYGRKPIVLIGLAGTALSSLLFGVAPNYWVALGARVVGGLLNGNVAVMQTMVAEMCKKPEHEPRAYTVMPFCWTLGSIVGSGMGGYLAQPARYMPHIFPPDGIFGKYPYLLPNLVAVIFIVLAIIQGIIFMEETNPRFSEKQEAAEAASRGGIGAASETTPLVPKQQRRSSCLDDLSIGPNRPSFASGSMPLLVEPTFNIRRTSMGTISEIKPTIGNFVEHAIEEEDDGGNTTPQTAFTREVILWIVQIVLMSYHQMAFGSLVPIFVVDDKSPNPGLDLRGGLGRTVRDVGKYMSINGVIALAIQLLIFPIFVAKVGVYKSIVWLTILMPFVYIVPPFLTLLDGVGLSAGIYVLNAVQNFFLIVIYPCLLIELKNVTPSTLMLGKVNGLAMSACSGARTVAPPLVGIIYGEGGSAAGWWSIAGFAFLAVIELYWMRRPAETGDHEVRNRVTREGSVIG